MAQAIISTAHCGWNAVYYNQTIAATYPATVGANNGRSLPTTSCLLYGLELDGNTSSLLKVGVLKDAATAGTSTTTLRLVGYSKGVFAIPSDTNFVPTVLAEFTLSVTTGTEVPLNFGAAGQFYPFCGMTQLSGTPAANIYSPVTTAATSTDTAFAVIDTMGAQSVFAQIKSATLGWNPVILFKQI